MMDSHSDPSKESSMENKTLRTAQYLRAVEVRAIGDDSDRTVELAFSSEAPVLRFFGYEVLDHQPSSINMERLEAGLPLLMHHDQTLLIGKIMQFEVAEGKLRGVAKFGSSELARQAYQDVKDGILTDSSIGYAIDMMEEQGVLDGEKVYRATKWTPLEVSLVSVPADITVGVGRSAEDTEHMTIVVEQDDTQPEASDEATTEVEVSDEAGEADSSERAEVDLEDRADIPSPDESELTEDAVPENREADSAYHEEAAMSDRKEINKQLTAMGRSYNMESEALDAIDNDASVEDFQAQIIRKISANTEAPKAEGRADEVGLTEKEAKTRIVPS
jgi:HK97 family phage prohead protease